MSLNLFKKTKNKKNGKEILTPLGTSRQLPAPESGRSRNTPVATSRQLPAPGSDSSQPTPMSTSRQLPAPETSSSSRQLPIRTSRQLPVPASSGSSSRTPLGTARQLPAPASKQRLGSSQNEESSRTKTSRLETLDEETSTTHTCTQEEWTRREGVRKQTSQKGSRSEKSSQNEVNHNKHSLGESSKKNTGASRVTEASRETHTGPSRTTQSTQKNTGASRVMEALRKTYAGPSRTTQAGPSRVTEATPASSKSKKNDYERTTVNKYTTKAAGKSYGTIKVAKTNLPAYATKGLTQHQVEVQQVLSIQVPCPAGYIWLKQEVGWRCEGSTHWLTDEQAERLGCGEDPLKVRCGYGPGPPGSWTNHGNAPKDAWAMVSQGMVPWTDDSVEKIDSQTHEIHSRSRSEQQVTIGNQQFIKSKLPEYATKNLTEHELEMQQLLTAYIPCPSYALWLKQEQGWRCAAGQHWITDEQVERLAKGEHPDNVRWQTGYGPKSNWTNPPHPEDFHAQIWETSARRCRLGVWGRGAIDTDHREFSWSNNNLVHGHARRGVQKAFMLDSVRHSPLQQSVVIAEKADRPGLIEAPESVWKQQPKRKKK